MKRIFILQVALVFANGCGAVYGGVTKVTWEASDGTRVEYISGKDLQGLEVDKVCEAPDTCTVHVKVKEATGIEAIKANAETLREAIKAGKDYGRAFGGGL